MKKKVQEELVVYLPRQYSSPDSKWTQHQQADRLDKKTEKGEIPQIETRLILHLPFNNFSSHAEIFLANCWFGQHDLMIFLILFKIISYMEIQN